MRREKGTSDLQQTVGAAHRLECRVEIIRALDRHRLKLQA